MQFSRPSGDQALGSGREVTCMTEKSHLREALLTLFFEMGSHYVVLVGLELAVQTQMTLNVQKSALAHLHAQLLCPVLSTLL